MIRNIFSESSKKNYSQSYLPKVNSDINVYQVITNLILSNDYEWGKRALIDLMFPPNNQRIFPPLRKW